LGVVVDVVYRERLLFGSEQLFGACAFITEVQVCFKRTSVEMIHVEDHAEATGFAGLELGIFVEATFCFGNFLISAVT
jgi:hypothetical protein